MDLRNGQRPSMMSSLVMLAFVPVIVVLSFFAEAFDLVPERWRRLIFKEPHSTPRIVIQLIEKETLLPIAGMTVTFVWFADDRTVRWHGTSIKEIHTFSGSSDASGIIEVPPFEDRFFPGPICTVVGRSDSLRVLRWAVSPSPRDDLSHSDAPVALRPDGTLEFKIELKRKKSA